MKPILATAALALGLAFLVPASAQTADELKQQLEAQKQINELLKQRIRKLEEELAVERGGAVEALAGQAPPPEPAPETEAGDPEQDRALERALVRRGLSVLPPGVWEFSPGLSWAHSGSEGAFDSTDDYVAAFDVRTGLPWGSMAGVGLPYFIESERGGDDNSGFGDLSLRYWKQFRSQGDRAPSLVGSLGYVAPTGEDAGGPIPLGSDFHRLNASLSSSRSIDPVVLSGGAGYTYVLEERIDGVDIRPGDSVSARVGASLAITPEITGNLGVSVAFIDELERDGIRLDGSERTVGFLELGAGFLISRKFFLSLFADIGVTDDAADLILGMSLPMRF